MVVSIIVTVLNEESSIAALLDSVLAQTCPPDEVVIVDGGSVDRTAEIAGAYQEKLPLRIIVAPGSNISQGRNLAIAAARGEVIASTDGGVRLNPSWLEEMTRPFPSSGQEGPAVVSGFFLPDPQTVFELAMGATVLPSSHEIDPATFLPSSRSVAFTKEAWERVGGYPEWLDYCEDLVFDIKLRRAGMTFEWAPEALAYFRPRPSFPSFFKQYYRYARGDGKAGLWPNRHLARYLAYLCATLILAGGGRFPLLLGILAVGVLFYLYRPYRRLYDMTAGISWQKKVMAALYVPLIRVVGDAAKLAGYPAGLWWRLRRKPPNW